MAPPANNLRKAAILVATLDSPVADQILARLAPGQAEQVRRAADNLGPISRSERDTALREFNAATSLTPHETSTRNLSRKQKTPTPNPSSAAGDLRRANGRGVFGRGSENGVEMHGSLATLLDQYDSRETSYSNQVPLARSFGDAEANTGQRSPDDRVAPFGFLEQTESSTLAAVLRKEHPQTVAFVLSSVAADRAAELLTCLPERLQLDVLHRMSELEPGDPESVRVLAGELRAWVENHLRNEQRRERGIATVRNILAATAAKDQAHLVRRIRACDAALAERLGDEIGRVDIGRERPAVTADRLAQPQESVVGETTAGTHRSAYLRPVTSPHALGSLFPQQSAQSQTNDLAHLGDAVWTRLLPAIEPQLLVLALTGEEQVLIDRVASHLTAKDAKALRQSLESLGPMRLSDVAAARDELVRIAAQIANTPLAAPLAA